MYVGESLYNIFIKTRERKKSSLLQLLLANHIQKELDRSRYLIIVYPVVNISEQRFIIIISYGKIKYVQDKYNTNLLNSHKEQYT